MYCFIAIVPLTTESCKKDKSIANEALAVTAYDLLGHYMALDIRENDRQKLCLIYFATEGGAPMAIWQQPGYGWVGDITMVNNKLSFDVGGIGTRVFELAFSKDASGSLSLKETVFKGTGDVQLRHAEMYHSSKVPAWGGKTFRKVNGPNAHLTQYYFSLDKGEYYTELLGAPTRCYPKEFNAGFYNQNDNLMGVFVPAWKGDANIKMLLGDKNIVGVASYRYN